MNRRRRKRLGQHFLKNPGVLRKIVRQISPQGDDLIIEIGAGRGALTFPLTEKAGKVIAFEKDKSFIPNLERKNIPNLIILEKDVLKARFRELVEKEGNEKKSVKLVGNLPYSISSPLLFRVLENRELFSECVFLLQKEVAQRLCAQPGSKKYAPLSILFQIYFLAVLHFLVSPESFSPPPKVQSALVSLKKREKPLFVIDEEELFHKFLKKAFQHRRKILWNNLERLPLPPSLLEEAFEKCGLKKNSRAEELPISKFVELFNALFGISSPKS